MNSKRFMIGQWVVFDKIKQKRDYQADFCGVELCILEKEQDISSFINYAAKNKIEFGVHFPLRAKQWKLRDPQFMSKSCQIKTESYDFLQKELHYITKYKPKHVLVHFPKPMLLNERANWSFWRFADDSEYYYQNEYSFELFLKQSKEFFDYFTDFAKRNNFIPVIEFDILNDYSYRNEEFYKLFSSYTNLRVCLDIARLHLQSLVDKDFCVNEVIDMYAKHTYLVHLSNCNPIQKINHYPPLRSLSSEDGWADVEPYLKRIKGINNNFKLLFEHKSYLINDEELNDCYNFIRDILR